MKKVIVPILTLIIGFGIGYMTRQMTATYPFANYKPGFAPKALTAEEKEIIRTIYQGEKFKFSVAKPLSVVPVADALKRIAEFKTQNDASNFPLTTNDNKNLVGFYINGDDLRAILSNPNSYDGVSVYLANDYGASQSGAQHVYSLVFMGAKKRPYDQTQGMSYDNTPFANPKTDATTYDFTLPCPTFCGNFNLPQGSSAKKQ